LQSINKNYLQKGNKRWIKERNGKNVPPLNEISEDNFKEDLSLEETLQDKNQYYK